MPCQDTIDKVLRRMVLSFYLLQPTDKKIKSRLVFKHLTCIGNGETCVIHPVSTYGWRPCLSDFVGCARSDQSGQQTRPY